MTIEHKDITDPNIHEPKGVNAAAINTFYKANGTGSGTWSKIPTQGLAGIASNGTLNQIVTVDGTGSQKLTWSLAHGDVYFINIGSPNTITYPSVYTKIAPTTTPNGSPREFTESTSASLIYTGTDTRLGSVHVSSCVSQSTGADRDVRIAIYKNGVIIPSSESVITATSGQKRRIATFTDINLVTNDVIEAYVRNDGASGDVIVYTFKLECHASIK